MRYCARVLVSGELIRDHWIEAEDPNHARLLLVEQGLEPISMREEGSLQRLSGRLLMRNARFSVLMFSQELLALLQAGLSIVESVEALAEKESEARRRAVFNRLLQNLMAGKRFSAALAEQSMVFPPLYVGVVRAAEGTSDLPLALQRYIGYQKRIDAVRGKVVSASIYPAILISVGSLVSLFLIVYVVPRFAEVYQGAGRELPWLSSLLLSWGQFAAEHTSLLLLGLAAVIGLVMLGWRRLQARGGVAVLLASLPVIGDRMRLYELSRLYLTLGMLLEGGIALVRAISIVCHVVPVATAKQLQLAGRRIEAGESLSASFKDQGLTTPISLRLLMVGERTGDLGAMLSKSAHFYDEEITLWIDRFMKSFEPLLMAAIGLVVGVIVVLLYMPIFDLAGSF